MMGMLFLLALATLRGAHFDVDLYLGSRGSVKDGLLGSFVDQLGRDYAWFQTTSK